MVGLCEVTMGVAVMIKGDSKDDYLSHEVIGRACKADVISE